jgi:hypothetical protein
MTFHQAEAVLKRRRRTGESQDFELITEASLIVGVRSLQSGPDGARCIQVDTRAGVNLFLRSEGKLPVSLYATFLFLSLYLSSIFE